MGDGPAMAEEERGAGTTAAQGDGRWADSSWRGEMGQRWLHGEMGGDGDETVRRGVREIENVGERRERIIFIAWALQ